MRKLRSCCLADGPYGEEPRAPGQKEKSEPGPGDRPLLAAGLVLAVLAQRRGWAPPLWAALCAGAVLRIAAMAWAVADQSQPYDFANDFSEAAGKVLDGLNPTMHMREGGWHFLPFLAYVLAGQQGLGELVGLSWG
ncbi:hypothetical protein ACFQYP_14445 [Nonomuraea antimicrobica]